MPLTETIAEVKEVLPKLVAKISSNSLLPNIRRAEEKYIVPLTGRELYDDLVTRYNTSNLDDDEQKDLIKYIRLVTAAYGYLDELPTLQLTLTNEGLRTMTTAEMTKVVGWEYKDFKAFLLATALDGVEAMLGHLWAHKVYFTLWRESDAYKQFTSLLIRTGAEFSQYYSLHQPMRTFYAFKPVVKDVQEDYLSDGFGEALMRYCISVESPSGEEEKIISLLKKALAYLTIKQAGNKYAIRMSDSGFTITNSGDPEGEEAGRSEASYKLLKMQLDACEQEGLKCISKAKKRLVAYRKSTDSSDEFNAAFDEGPLVSYIDSKVRDSGNSRRKIFRM